MCDTHIRFEIDNTTAVSYVNGMGTCKSAACNEVAKTGVLREVYG